ncbi:MAG: hypothetical protein HYV07_30600 [Deltaproteobacteria bacterium]|nr:hypothetical protein [Deltaproteobacteria bacterium]
MSWSSWLGLSLAIWVGQAARAAEDPRILVEHAQEARARGDLERSLGLLVHAIELDPHPVLIHNLARTYEDLGRYLEAREAYQRVMSDPRAPGEVRAKDAERVAELEGKCDRAWLAIETNELSGALWIDGHSPDRSVAEHPVAPGLRVVEIGEPGGRARLWFVEASLGRRTKVSLGVESETGQLVLGVPDEPGSTSPNRAETVIVDEYQLVTARPSSVSIPIGQHRVRARFTRGEVDLPVNVEAGREVIIKPSPLALSTTEAAGASTTVPFVILGSGVALTTLGVVLAVSAGSMRAEAAGLVGSDGFLDPYAYTRSRELEARATTSSTLGITALVAGVLLMSVAVPFISRNP